MRLEKGYIQVYTGTGKGKTTAALGLALRASGHGMKTRMIQFMKGNTNYGECKAIARIPEITLQQFGTPDLIRKGGEREIDFEEAVKALAAAREALLDPEISILILDEINVALYFGLLELEDVLTLIDSKPEHLELIMTGRGVPEEIVAKAHLVTRMEMVKHYYEDFKQIAREGIEC